jgi:FkbM family methyltransferase
MGQAREYAKRLVRRLLRSLGLDVVAYSAMRSHELRRAAFLRDHGIGLIVDGGAHKGEYALTLRRLGYWGEILSIEPLPGPFLLLQRRAATDHRWRCINVALGERCGQTVIHENPITEVSSLLRATGMIHTEGWRATKPLQVEVRTIESILRDSPWNGGLYIKLDVQGYEMQVLAGAGSALDAARGIELELSTVELYEGSVLLPTAISHLDQLGFSLFSAEPALVDYDSARVLQLDCLFVRNGELLDATRANRSDAGSRQSTSAR